jgi:hypothetical protein
LHIGKYGKLCAEYPKARKVRRGQQGAGRPDRAAECQEGHFYQRRNEAQAPARANKLSAYLKPAIMAAFDEVGGKDYLRSRDDGPTHVLRCSARS